VLRFVKPILEGKVTKRGTLLLIGAAVLCFAAWAAKSAGILHPDWAVEHGSYDKPMATIGTKPAQPWSGTTVSASIDNKPQPGKPVTMVGEIVDFSCYLQVGKHGEKHRACGQKCIQNGNPVGLLTKDGSLYMLMAEEHDPRRDGGVSLTSTAGDHMGHIVEVNGTEASVNGYNAIFIQGLSK